MKILLFLFFYMVLIKAFENPDFIVVGSGGGSLVANRLFRSGKYSVVLLEAGGDDSGPEIQNIENFFQTTLNPKINWYYPQDPNPAQNNRTDTVIQQGKVLGGGFSLNQGDWLRGSPQDFEDWENKGAKGWGTKEMYAAYEEFELRMDEQNEEYEYYLSKNYSLPITRSTSTEFFRKFKRAALNKGVNYNEDYNRQQGPLGLNLMWTNVDQSHPKALRRSTYRVFVEPYLNRPNFKLISNALVTKVLFKEKTAIGVEYIDNNNQKIQLLCKKEVIICAGAINSPQLLLLSGIGDRNELAKFNIPLIHHSPGVGQGLLDHPVVLSIWGYDGKKDPQKNVITSVLFGRNDLSYDKSEGSPDFEVMFIDRIGGVPGVDALPPGNNLITLVCSCVKPFSKGYVKLQSSDPTVYPKVHMPFLTDQRDISCLENSIYEIRRIISSDPELSSLLHEYTPGTANLEDFIRSNTNSEFHSSGTLRMGTDYYSPINPKTLKVKGVKNLRVIDASVFPSITTCNTQAAVLAVAYRGSGFILKQYDEQKSYQN